MANYLGEHYGWVVGVKHTDAAGRPYWGIACYDGGRDIGHSVVMAFERRSDARAAAKELLPLGRKDVFVKRVRITVL